MLNMRYKTTDFPEASLKSAYELALKAHVLDDRNADAYLAHAYFIGRVTFTAIHLAG